MTTRKTNYLKKIQVTNHVYYQLELQVNILKNTYSYEERVQKQEGTITLATLKKAQKEIQDLKRLCKRRFDVNDPDSWLSLLN